MKHFIARAAIASFLAFSSSSAIAQDRRLAEARALDGPCVTGPRPEDVIQLQINRMRDQIDKGTMTAADASTHDRRKAALDNLQKFLDIVRSMNPQI